MSYHVSFANSRIIIYYTCSFYKFNPPVALLVNKKRMQRPHLHRRYWWTSRMSFVKSGTIHTPKWKNKESHFSILCLWGQQLIAGGFGGGRSRPPFLYIMQGIEWMESKKMGFPLWNLVFFVANSLIYFPSMTMGISCKLKPCAN